jgi:transporter family-2 protein
MSKNLWMLFTLLAGALLPIQAALNTRLGKVAQNPVWGSAFSFLVGSIVLLCYLLVTRQNAAWSALKASPAYFWMGGLIGAYYVTLLVFAFPKLGPGLTFGLVVAGQMIISLVLEHNNWLVQEQTPVNFMRILGVVLIVAGVIILRRF